MDEEKHNQQLDAVTEGQAAPAQPSQAPNEKVLQPSEAFGQESQAQQLQPQAQQPTATVQPNPQPTVTSNSPVVYQTPISGNEILARKGQNKRKMYLSAIVVFASILVVGGGIAMYSLIKSSATTTTQDPKPQTKPTATATQPQDTKVAAKEAPVVPTGWKEYTFTDNGAAVSFWHPADWTVESYSYTASKVYAVTGPKAPSGGQVGFTIRVSGGGPGALEQRVASLPGNASGKITEKESRKVRNMDAIEYVNYSNRSIDFYSGTSFIVSTTIRLGDSSKQSQDYALFNQFVNSISVN